MKKTVKLIIYASVIMMIGAGCMSKNISEEDFLAMMKEKYNEEFTITGGGDESWNASSTNVYLRSESHPDQSIKAIWNGEQIIDNYVYILQQENVEAVLREMLDPIYDDYKVFFSIGMPLLRLSPDMTTAEFMESISKNQMGVDICVQDENYMNTKDEKLELVRLAFKEKEYSPGLTVVYMEPNRLEEVNRDNLYQLFTGATSEEWLVMRGDISMNDDYDFSYADWREK